MVSVAQLVEPWIVIPVVVGSSPITHPSIYSIATGQFGWTIIYIVNIPAKSSFYCLSPALLGRYQKK